MQSRLNTSKLFLFTLLIPLIWSSCADDTPDITSKVDFDNYLQEELTDQNLPALSVLIFKNNEVKYEKNLGESDIENGTALASEDMFLLASVSKMVTGVALLQLYEEGKFSLDDPINDHLPFNVNVPNKSTAITFRMLLTHTSAIDDGANSQLFYSYGKDSPLDLKKYLEEYLTPGGEYYDASDNFHDYEPGSSHDYSNMASALIGVLVAEISGKDFRTYCREKIFDPLQMTNTYWSLDLALQSGKTIVKPYEYKNRSFEAIDHYTFPDYPNGGLRSSARDMMHFLSALAQGGLYEGTRILKEGTVEEMLTLQIPNLDNTFGLHAFQVDETNKLWGHNGGEQGVSTEVGFNKETDVGAIVLTNLADVDLNEILIEAYKLGLTL